MDSRHIKESGKKINRSGKLSTSTSKVRRKYNGIGFYNKPHYDPNDKIPAKYTLHWIEDQKLHKNFKEKVSGMHHNLGIGFPTTIGYNFCEENLLNSSSAGITSTESVLHWKNPPPNLSSTGQEKIFGCLRRH